MKVPEPRRRGDFAIRASREFVECWTADRIAFDNKPAWQADQLMPALRRALAGLRFDEGDSLRAVFASDDPAERDVENALITNVGASAFRSCPDHLVFERSFERPEQPLVLRQRNAYRYLYRYAPSEGSAALEHWAVDEILASWPPVPIEGLRDGNARRIWLSFRRAREAVKVEASGLHHGWFGLRLALEVPATAATRLLTNLEWLIDGVVAAFQRVDAAGADRLAPAIAQAMRLGAASARELRAALTDGPALLPAPPFLQHATWVQVNPADTRLVAGEASLRVGETSEVRVSGSLFTVRPT